MDKPTQAAEDPHSHAEVDVHDKAAIERWSKALQVPDSALMAAVQAVGPRIDRIKDYLGAGGSAGRQQGG